MHRFLILAAITVAVPFMFNKTVYSQDELPQGGQPGRPAASQPGAAPAPANAEYKQQVSYALGRNFAENLRENEIELDLNSLVAGISDLLSGAKPKWTDEQLQPTMKRFSQEMRSKAMNRVNQQSAKNKQEAEAFLAQNGKREGVQTTP